MEIWQVGLSARSRQSSMALFLLLSPSYSESSSAESVWHLNITVIKQPVRLAVIYVSHAVFGRIISQKGNRHMTRGLLASVCGICQTMSIE